MYCMPRKMERVCGRTWHRQGSCCPKGWEVYYLHTLEWPLRGNQMTVSLPIGRYLTHLLGICYFRGCLAQPLSLLIFQTFSFRKENEEPQRCPDLPRTHIEWSFSHSFHWEMAPLHHCKVLSQGTPSRVPNFFVLCLCLGNPSFHFHFHFFLHPGWFLLTLQSPLPDFCSFTSSV